LFPLLAGLGHVMTCGGQQDGEVPAAPVESRVEFVTPQAQRFADLVTGHGPGRLRRSWKTNTAELLGEWPRREDANLYPKGIARQRRSC
jgi:hypothetical protein